MFTNNLLIIQLTLTIFWNKMVTLIIPKIINKLYKYKKDNTTQKNYKNKNKKSEEAGVLICQN